MTELDIGPPSLLQAGGAPREFSQSLVKVDGPEALPIPGRVAWLGRVLVLLTSLGFWLVPTAASTGANGTSLVALGSGLMVDPRIDPPSTGVAPDRALTDGRAFDIAGTVRDSDATTGAPVACGPEPAPTRCSVTGALLHQFDSSFEMAGPAIDLTSQASIDEAGNLRGNVAVTFDPAARSAMLEVAVQNDAGNEAVGLSSLIEVDTIEPTITRASIAVEPLTGLRRMVVVRFSEPVCGNSVPLDWMPLPVEVRRGGTCGGMLELHYTTEFPEGSGGELSYEPSAVSERFRDRAWLFMEDQTVPFS